MESAGIEEDDFFSEITKVIRSGSLDTKDDLQRLKMSLASKYSLGSIPSDTEIMNSAKFTPAERRLLRLKRTRTISGVAVVAAMTSPERCPHGRCIYCPGGVENNSPQAYTGHEPAALRGRAHSYDPYNQVFHRLLQLETIGHDISKVDLIIMGGTFTARNRDYQESFVKGCFDAMNKSVSSSLEESILANETAERRCIGLTVETKPDWFFEKEIDLSLDYGTTKVELGVQIVNERVLRMNHRGHGVDEIIKSTGLARDAGLKIVYHLMPGMHGSVIEDDIESFRQVCENPDFRPDMLKIYPTLVVKGTALYNLWKMGEYVPLTTDEISDLLAGFMARMPPWIRVQRVQRDIPVTFIEAGVKRSDIRNLVEAKMRKSGHRTMEIRSREVGFDSASSKNVFEPVRRDYDAGHGTEAFLSFEDADYHIAGFLRLRKPSAMAHRPELAGSSIIREIKVLGEAVHVGDRPDLQWQHKGFGKKLISWAEDITMNEFGLDRILVISGIGVREYFRKLGYERVGPYMGKALDRGTIF